MNWSRLGQLAGAIKTGIKSGHDYVGGIVEQHKGVRRALVVWAAVLVTWVTYRVYRDGANISLNEAAAYATTCGILGTVLALYHIGRGREDCK